MSTPTTCHLTNATFSVVNTDLSMMPTSKLNVDVFANYSSNLNAQIISGIIGGPQTNATTAQAAPVTQNLLSKYLDYGANTGYSFTRQLTLTARADTESKNIRKARSRPRVTCSALA